MNRSLGSARTTCRRLAGGLAVVAALLIAPAGAFADFQVVSGNVTVLTPSASNPVNLNLHQTTSDTNMFAFTESQNNTLSQSVAVDFTGPGAYNQFHLSPGTIAKGTQVNSYMFHSDVATASLRSPPGVVYDAVIHFDQPIIGGQFLNSTLRLYDAPPNSMGNPNVQYPTTPFSGSEFNDLTIEKMDAQTLDIKFHTYQALDELRIFTAAAAAPEPASLTLACMGVVGLGGFALRKRLRKAAN